MILDVCQCSQLFFDVFSWVVTFMDNHPLCGHFFSGCPQLITDILYRFSDVFKICSDVLRCSQMFSDDHRCFWIFSRYSIDVLLMFSRCSLDVPRMIAGFFQDDHFNNPKVYGDTSITDGLVLHLHNMRLSQDQANKFTLDNFSLYLTTFSKSPTMGGVGDKFMVLGWKRPH